jgi:hypothetical protein
MNRNIKLYLVPGININPFIDVTLCSYHFAPFHVVNGVIHIQNILLSFNFDSVSLLNKLPEGKLSKIADVLQEVGN